VDPLAMPLPDRRPDEDEPGEPERRPDRLQGLRRFFVEHLVPVLLTVGLNLAQRLRYFPLLPLPAELERAFANFALLLGAAAALVASVTFSRADDGFDFPAFMGTAGAGLVTATPFILSRAGFTLGLSPRHFDILTTFAYLGFFAVIGVLVAGCWSVVVHAVCDARGSSPPRWPAHQVRRRY